MHAAHLHLTPRIGISAALHALHLALRTHGPRPTKAERMPRAHQAPAAPTRSAALAEHQMRSLTITAVR